MFAIPLSSRKAEHRFVLVAGPERKEAALGIVPPLPITTPDHMVCGTSVEHVNTTCVSASACGLSSCVVRVRELRYTHLALLDNSDG